MATLQEKMTKLAAQGASVEVLTTYGDGDFVFRGVLTQSKTLPKQFYINNGECRDGFQIFAVVMVTVLDEVYNYGYILDGCRFRSGKFKKLKETK